MRIFCEYLDANGNDLVHIFNTLDEYHEATFSPDLTILQVKMFKTYAELVHIKRIL